MASAVCHVIPKASHFLFLVIRAFLPPSVSLLISLLAREFARADGKRNPRTTGQPFPLRQGTIHQSCRAVMGMRDHLRFKSTLRDSFADNNLISLDALHAYLSLALSLVLLWLSMLVTDTKQTWCSVSIRQLCPVQAMAQSISRAGYLEAAQRRRAQAIKHCETGSVLENR